MDNKRLVGAAHEQLAVVYLESLGYKILERNYRRRTGEIDLIALDQGTLAFIEVKYRGSRRKGSPEAAVDHRKQARIYRTAEFYLTEHRDWRDHLCRFDVIAVEGKQMRLYRDAFGGL